LISFTNGLSEAEVHDVGCGVVSHYIHSSFGVDEQLEFVANLEASHLHRARVEHILSFLLHIRDHNFVLSARTISRVVELTTLLAVKRRGIEHKTNRVSHLCSFGPAVECSDF